MPGAVDIISNKNYSFLLYPLTQSEVKLVEEYLPIFDIIFMSRFIGIISEANIISKVVEGKRDLFEFISGFEYPVWISILISINVIPITFSIIDKSFSKFAKDLWNLSFILLSEPIQKLPKAEIKRFLTIIWLLSCTVFLSSFAGTLRGFYSKSIPNIGINSWEDLYERNDLRIATSKISYMNNYVENNINNNEMARNFKSRMNIIELYDNKSIVYFIEQLIKGKYAISAVKHKLEEYYPLVGSKIIDDRVKLHISEYGGGISPYFIPFSKSIDMDLKINLNKM